MSSNALTSIINVPKCSNQDHNFLNFENLDLDNIFNDLTNFLEILGDDEAISETKIRPKVTINL